MEFLVTTDAVVEALAELFGLSLRLTPWSSFREIPLHALQLEIN